MAKKKSTKNAAHDLGYGDMVHEDSQGLVHDVNLEEKAQIKKEKAVARKAKAEKDYASHPKFNKFKGEK